MSHEPVSVCRLTSSLPVKMDRLHTIARDGSLVFTAPPVDVDVCRDCPNLHVRLLPRATPEALREYARAILELAYAVESAR